MRDCLYSEITVSVSHLFLTVGSSDFVDIFDKPEFCLLLINPCHWSPRNEKNKSKHPSPKVPGGLGLCSTAGFELHA